MVAALTETLEAISEGGSQDRIRLEDLVNALSRRGFGALILGPAVLIVLPTGAIPGVPAVCGLLIALLAAQMALGRKRPWLPQRLTRLGIDRHRYDAALTRARPITRWIDRFFRKRLVFLTHPIAQRLIAAICVVLSFGVIVLGFVPFLAAVLAAPIVLFGLSLIAKDGLLAGIGLILVGAMPLGVPLAL